jgi:hypothetical protein
MDSLLVRVYARPHIMTTVQALPMRETTLELSNTYRARKHDYIFS